MAKANVRLVGKGVEILPTQKPDLRFGVSGAKWNRVGDLEVKEMRRQHEYKNELSSIHFRVFSIYTFFYNQHLVLHTTIFPSTRLR